MSNAKFSSWIKYVRARIKSLSAGGDNVLISAYFITGKDRVKTLEKASPEYLSLLGKSLKYEDPDKVRIDYYNGKDTRNTIWVDEFPLKEKQDQSINNSGFQGLGEAEINRIVDERFQEKQRMIEFDEMKNRVQELTTENDELHDQLFKLETAKEQLETDLESKKQIRYYAGMLGDILESFGIAKDKVKRPLAELMGFNDDEKKDKNLNAHKEDNSGIVDEGNKTSNQSEEDQKRNEIISLVADYLKTTSNTTLANIFSIFSEIEQNNVVADDIIQFLNTKKK